MKFFWVWNGKKIKQLSIIVVAAFFAAGLLFIERNELMVLSTPEGPQAFYKATTDEKKVALTFNISWGDQRAIPILDILKERGVTATFFISASWAERHPDIVKRIVEDGHEIGSHGYRYENYPNKENDKITKDIRDSHNTIENLTGKKPTLLRPPNGQFDKRTLKIAEQFGYTVVHWSVSGEDYENPGVEAIVDNVVSNVSKGDIVLLHASDTVKQTHNALPIILDKLLKDGYRLETVSTLIAGTTANSEEIK